MIHDFRRVAVAADALARAPHTSTRLERTVTSSRRDRAMSVDEERLLLGADAGPSASTEETASRGRERRFPSPRVLGTACAAAALALVVVVSSRSRFGEHATTSAISSLGASGGWLSTTKRDEDRRVESRLGVERRDGPRDVASWLGEPEPVYELERAYTRDGSTTSSWTLVIGDESELWKIPVCKRGGGYRVGNAVKRVGRGWVEARIRVLSEPESYKTTLLYEFLMSRVEGTKAFAAAVVARERERGTLSRSAMGATLQRSVVMPMRLSDKARFVESNERTIIDAALDYRRAKCPQTCEKFVIAVSLVWGGDEVGPGGEFAYDVHEYRESIRVLQSMLTYAKEKFPADFELNFAVTSDADDALTLLAYAPNLMSNPLDSASTIIELAQGVNALINTEHGVENLLQYHDEVLAKRQTDASAINAELGLLARIRNVVERARGVFATDDSKVFVANWLQVACKRLELNPEEVPNEVLSHRLSQDVLIDALWSERDVHRRGVRVDGRVSTEAHRPDRVTQTVRRFVLDHDQDDRDDARADDGA